VLLPLGRKQYSCVQGHLLCLHYALCFNAVICCSQLNTRGVFRRYPREWIISHRCSWMAVYVFCCNAQSESHSDPHDVCTLSLFYQLPNCNLFTSMCYLSYGETPLVNCEPRSNFLYIAIPFYFYSHYLLSCILLYHYHSIHSILYLQQTGEIDNLIVSWEQSSWLCCVQVSCCCWWKATCRQAVNLAPLSGVSQS
jgi:hypothetical protein